MRPVHLIAHAAAVTMAAGCDPLASRDYVGEPLITLTGTFATAAPTAAPEAPIGGVALMWQDSAGPEGPGGVATAVPVAIAFPATFQIDVPAPPPAGARFSFADGDVQLAEAYVFVVEDPAAAHLVTRGADRAHVLVYASADVAAGTLAADYLGGAVTAGYHLRRFTTATPAAHSAQASLIARCVANTGAASACATRRGYQLAAIADDAPLRIAVSPP